MQLGTFLISTLAACVVAAPAPAPPSNHVLHEKREFTPRAWEKRDRVDPSQLLPVRIGLTQSNLDQGPGLLDEVYGHSLFYIASATIFQASSIHSKLHFKFQGALLKIYISC